MEPLPFTIEDYQKLVVEAGTHEVISPEEGPARVICTDRPHEKYTVVALINGIKIYTFTADGHFIDAKHPRKKDLQIVPKPPKSLGWVNVWEKRGHYSFTEFATEEEAKREDSDGFRLVARYMK